jgi:hypothetical protein
MTAQIRPNRMQVNDRFPMLGFAVRTAQPDVQAEVVLASAIDLFRPENRARRTAANFYSSREHGLLSVPRGEGVFVVPPEVLARFIGQDKLFFALATGRAEQGGLQVDAAPREGSPYVSLTGFTGRTLRRSFAPARVGSPPLLEWTGDAAQPGSEPARTAQPAAANGSRPASQQQPAASVDYNDGFGELPELPAREAAYRGRPEAARADGLAVMPDLPNAARQRAARIGGAFAQRVGEALDLGLPEASVAPLLDKLDPPQRPAPLDNDLFATPQSYAQSLSRSIHWPDVQLVNQPTDNSCWATTIAMLVGWHDQTSVAPQTIAQQAGKSIDKGLAWSEHRSVAQRLGLNPIPPQCYTAEGLYELIERDGPLYISKMASASNLSGHAVLAVGMYQDGGQYFVRIADPWDRSVGTPGSPGSYQSTHNTGSRYILRFEDFESEYELQAVRDTSTGDANVQMFSLGVPAGRQPDRSGNPPAGFAMSLGSAAMGVGTSRSIHWDDVQLVAQPTPLSCWAASMAMVLGWRDQVSITPQAIADRCGRDIGNVLPWAEHDDLGIQLGFTVQPPMNYTPEGFWNLLECEGPVWVGKSMGSATGNTHIVVVVGMLEQGGTYHVRVLDPANGGQRYIREYNRFASEYELGMRSNAQEVFTQVLTPGVPAGRAINRGTSAPSGFAMGVGGGRWSVQWDDVQLIPQPTDNGCWATTLAMLIGWRDQVSIAPQTIAQQCGKDIAHGLPWAERQAAATALGLTAHPPQCYLPEGFKALIENHGPLYVGKMASSTNLSGHAVLVVGMYTDGTNHFVRVADPWDRPVGTPGSPGNYAPTHNTGSRYIMKYEDFQAEYEMAADGDPAYVQILSGGVPAGRSVNRSTSAPAGYAMAGGERRAAAPPPPPVNRGQALDVGAAATIAGTAIEVISANSGDIATHLSNWAGVKHPGDRAPARQAAFQEGTVTLRDWPLVGGTFGLDDIYCWLQIRWQYNGTSLGRIYIEDIGHDDAAGWGLTVTATIEDDSRLYARSSQARAAGPAQVPALHINIQYVFDEVIADDQIANTRVTLYADGTYDVTSRWVQHSRPGGGNPTNVVRPFEHA